MLNERRKNTHSNEAYPGLRVQPTHSAPGAYHVLPFYHRSYLLGHPLCSLRMHLWFWLWLLLTNTTKAPTTVPGIIQYLV